MFIRNKNLKKNKNHDFMYGRKYGELTVEKSYIKGSSRVCECTCNCGEELIVPYSKLIKGLVRKCKNC